MGLRLHRSIKLLPGLRLNFGNRGISNSIGVRGAHVTFGRTGTRTAVGLPGRGMSYTHLEKRRNQPTPVQATHLDPETSPGIEARGMLWIAAIVVVLIAAVLAHLAQP
jgi:hypothetical protein